MNHPNRTTSRKDCKTEGYDLPQSLWEHYSSTIDAHFQFVLTQLEQRFTPYPSLHNAWRTLHAYLSNKGKRLRPLLFLSSYDLLCEDEAFFTEGILNVACALELFHAFALIHDDIIDESHSRRGEPTLHIRLHQEKSVKNANNSSNLAIIFGDILFGYAMECFVNPQLPSHCSTRALRYFLRIAQDTGIGQAIEIANLEQTLTEVSKREILDTYYLKTTRYTIEGPVVIGAILAGAKQSTLSQLSYFTQPLGLAFQIENDLHELHQINSAKPSLAYDLRSGVKTYLLKVFYDALNDKDRLILENCLRPGGTCNPLHQINRLLQKTSVKTNLQDMTRHFFAESNTRLKESDMPLHYKQQLHALVDYLSKNSHHSEANDTDDYRF